MHQSDQRSFFRMGNVNGLFDRQDTESRSGEGCELRSFPAHRFFLLKRAKLGRLPIGSGVESQLLLG